MSRLRFDGRVAIVTGAGRGIGRAYARLLAERGASVVVNDLGGSMGGSGADDGPAKLAAEEIVSAGGTALADSSDVSSPEGAEALVAAAVETYGGIDILVNNAGIMRWARFPGVSDDDFTSHLAVHTIGSFLTARAAWPHMAERGYGRIVSTASAGMLGLPANTAYAAAKGGVVGLTRSLATAGASLGITANVIAPAAWTRMAGPDADADPQLSPDLVAPMVAYLAHESCPVSGEIYAAGANRFARLFIAATPGYVHPGAAATVEDVAANWAAVNDESGYHVPADLLDWQGAFLAHLAEPASQAEPTGQDAG